MRRISLNGAWTADLGQGPVTALVPGCWEQLTESKVLTGPVDYKRSFVCPKVSPGGRWLLVFDAVSYYCEASINGRPVGSHEGLWDRFSFDITDALLPEGPNELTLSIEKPGYAPADRFPLREVLSGFIPDVLCTFGGIWGDVGLIETPGLLAENCTVQTDLTRGMATIAVEAPGSFRDGTIVIRLLRAGAALFEGSLASPGASTASLEIPLRGLR
ncbi:MAG TPA: hypothetical protein VFH83_09700, partial [Spirochaetia bacterium]|nr:hypothetical protein [Spirochaetia bacterium]